MKSTTVAFDTLREEHKRFIAEHGEEQIMKAFGVTRRVVREWKQKLRKAGYYNAQMKPPPDISTLARDAAVKRVQRNEYTALQAAHAELQRKYDTLVSVDPAPPARPIVQLRKEESEATACVIASDWHLEERVTREQTQGANEYNLKIAEESANRFFVNTAKLVKKERVAVPIRRLVAGFIGDFFTNSIHPDLAETNLLPPTEASYFSQQIIAGGLAYWYKELAPIELIVICKDGNHGRFTKYTQVQTRTGNSLEWYMYKNIALQCPFAKFIIERNLQTYLQIYGVMTRWTHGDIVNYGGGVGGISIPINKAIAQWNTLKHADLDLMGHFHEDVDGGNFIVNNSMIGTTAYTTRIKGKHSTPNQRFFLIDSKRGRTVSAPVFVR